MPENGSPMTRREFADFLESLSDYFDEDRVTRDDDRAISAVNYLRYYLLDHMTDEDFVRLTNNALTEGDERGM